MNHPKAFIAIFLIIGLLTPYVSFALIGDVAGVAQCSLLNGIVQLIVSRVVNKAVGLLNKAVDKAIEFFSFGFLKAADDVNVTNEDQAAVSAKELFKDTISRCIARQILNRMNQGILVLTRKMGREGGPTFVQNWRNFQTNAQYRGEDVFRAMLSNTKMCDYFGNDIKNLFGVTQKTSLTGQNTRTGNLDPYALRSNCTMPSNFKLANYQNDFAGNGGWNAWSRMLEPQNNYYGALFQSLDETAKQRALEESGDILETQGHGFTSKRGDNANASCQLRGASGRCIIYNEIETPGGIISELSAETLKSELNWLVSVDELNEIIMNMYGVMINRLTDLSGKRGLNETSPPIEGDPGLDEELIDRTPFPPPPISPPGGGQTCADVPSAQSCSVPNQANIVQQVKEDLLAQNISISGLCGAFEITKRVACAVGAGLLATNHSGSCNGFAAGNIAYSDDSEVDILGDEGGANNPQWNPGPDNPEIAVHYTPANCQ